MAGQIYRSKDKPRYIPGYSASLGLVAMAGIGYVISAVYMASMNEARDAVQAEEAKDRMGASGGGLGQEARARNEQAAQEAEKAGNEQKVQVQASDELEANTGGGAVRRRTRGAWFVAGTGAKSDLGDRTVGFRYLL